MLPVTYNSLVTNSLYCLGHILCIWLNSLWHIKCIFMVALWNRAGHYIFILWFPLLSSFFLFSSTIASHCRLDAYHTSTHVAIVCKFRMQVFNVLHAARWKYMTQKIAKNLPSVHHRTTLSGYIFATKAWRHASKIGKKLVNSNIFSTCPHNMVNFGSLTAKICWRIWGTPANFNRFRVCASLLQRRRSPEANQTLHDA